VQAWIVGWLLSSAGTWPAPGAGTRVVRELPLVDAPQISQASRHHPWLDIPLATWIAGGVAAGAFGTGLGFGIAANDIDHRAGLSVSQSGVDLGLTRSTALAGQRDAAIANGLFIGAGVAALVALAFAAFEPESARSSR
jgi:hypothetical protein